MFEIGKLYDLRTYEEGVEGGITVSYGRRVVDTDGPLIKVMVNGQTTIINTTSPSFFSAELHPDQ